jgi:hypothetical protein
MRAGRSCEAAYSGQVVGLLFYLDLQKGAGAAAGWLTCRNCTKYAASAFNFGPAERREGRKIMLTTHAAGAFFRSPKKPTAEQGFKKKKKKKKSKADSEKKKKKFFSRKNLL